MKSRLKPIFITLLIFLASIQRALPQEVIIPDSLNTEKESTYSTQKKRPIISRVYETVYDFFMGCDTNYVKPIDYDFSAWTDLSLWRDYYFMRSSETDNTMIISSDPSAILGFSLSYKFIGYGLSYNLNDIGKPNGDTNGTSMRQVFSVHTSKLFAEYYIFNSGKGAEIRHITDTNLSGKDRKFRGLNSFCKGLAVTYFFNNRRYSWPAAFDAGAMQRKSSGTWSLGIQLNEQKIQFNKHELPEHLKNTIDSTLLFSEVNYKDYSVSFGYNYNWVLKRNCLFAISFLPTIGYRKSQITEASQKHSILNNLSTDLALRASINWNTGKYFSGFNVELHTYSYRQNKFGLTNTYGTIKYTIGFNFW